MENPKPPKQKRRKQQRSRKTATSGVVPRSAWSRLDVNRQAEIAIVADRILVSLRDDNHDRNNSSTITEDERASSFSSWKELAVRELRLGMIPDDDDATATPYLPNTKDDLCERLAFWDWQTQLARKVFGLMDTNGKGCIVAQDLLNADLDGVLQEDDVLEMIEEFAPNGGVLSEDDIIRIARMVNLS